MKLRSLLMISIIGLGFLSASIPAADGAAATPAVGADDFALSAQKKPMGNPPPPTADGKPISRGDGIWKAVAPRDMRGEFDNGDVIGLVSGKYIKADCSINWVHPDDGKLYCFSSGTSLVYFQQQPNTYILRAGEAWKTINTISSDLGE